MFHVYEENVSYQVRSKALQLIEKILIISSDEVLKGFLRPGPFAEFMFSTLTSKSIGSIEISVRIVLLVLEKNPDQFIVPLMREGVCEQITALLDEKSFAEITGTPFVGKRGTEEEEKKEEVPTDKSESVADKTEKGEKEGKTA